MARRDAFGVYHFAVEIDGVQEAFFRSCSGLASEAEVVPVQEGGLNTTEHKLMGRTKFSNLVLKQGFATSSLWDKRASFVNDDPGTPLVRFNGTVIQFGPGATRSHSWQFTNAWICKWEGPEFDASKNEISIESIEIAHEGLIYKGGS
jgi:phage tail-like protein